MQVRTDVFEFFTEVRNTGWRWHRFLPGNRSFKPDSNIQTTLGSARSPSQRAAVLVCNVGAVLGGCVSGILGGMAIMTLLHLNLFNLNIPAGRTDLALHYYAPIALAVNRTYWGLIAVAVSSSISRFMAPNLLLYSYPRLNGILNNLLVEMTLRTI